VHLLQKRRSKYFIELWFHQRLMLPDRKSADARGTSIAAWEGTR
jgi:hypothetical protein